jgi:4-hydroxy-4-methyl-2-oxoglutarate aldolase
MKNCIWIAIGACFLITSPAHAQFKQTRAQIMYWTSEWKGPRFPDGRPKVPAELLKRVLQVTFPDLHDYMASHGYHNQYTGGFQSLHVNQPFAGRAVTAQFMPSRPDMAAAVRAEGKAEGRVGGTNEWVIEQLQMGDTMVVDGYGKIIRGTIIGSNLASGIAAHTHGGFVFYAGIRDLEEGRTIPNLNGLFLGYDPSAWSQMLLTGINVPIRIGRATVLPGDIVYARPREGVIFIPPQLAEGAINECDYSKLQDYYNFTLNYAGKNEGRFEGGWTTAKMDAFRAYIHAHPEKLNPYEMTMAEFDAQWNKVMAQQKTKRGM